MAISRTFDITGATTTLSCNFGATDRETIVCYLVSTGGVISSAEYTITGVSDSSANIVLTFDDLTAYVGDSIKVIKFTDIDTGNVADSMLVDLTTAANISPTTLRNEFRHLYGIVGQITGRSAVGTVDLGTVADSLDNINAVGDLLFDSPTLDGDGNWDGSDTLSIGGDTTVQGILNTHEIRLDADDVLISGHEGRVDLLEASVSDLLDLAGIPNPYVPVLPSGTRLIFQQTAAPTGWTKDTDAAYNTAMVVGTTGAVGTGGSANPTTMAHTHTAPGHSLTLPNHQHSVNDHTHTISTLLVDNVATGGSVDDVPYGWISGTTSVDDKTGLTTTNGGGGAAISGSINSIPSGSISPKYFSAIVASKD